MTVSVTPAMAADFKACMRVMLRSKQAGEVEAFKQDLRDVVSGHGRDYAATWIAGWRTELEANGPTGVTGLEIERRGL